MLQATLSSIHLCGAEYVVLGPPTLVQHLLNPGLHFSAAWETRTLHLRRNDSSYFSWLLGLQHVDKIIASGLALERDGRLENTVDIKLIQRRRGSDGEWWSAMARRSAVVEVEEAHAAFRAGFTIVINKMNCRVKQVGQLAEALSLELGGVRVNANLYLSPASSEHQG